MNAYMLSEMTWEEVGDALKTVEVAVIPIGAHEQHGPHMVESCDAVLATEMAKQLAEKMFPRIIVTPTINMGVSEHHMNFPGTISLKPETLIAILKDVVRSLKHHGITKFLFLNAHGGNQSTLSVASTTLSAEESVEVYYAKTTASAKQTVAHAITSPIFGHSCEREVSEALYLAPSLVRADRLAKGDFIEGGRYKQLRPGKAIQGFYRYEDMTRNGSIGDATKASREIGEQIVQEAVENITLSLEEILDYKVESVH
ncbi:creatininase family protein [Halobacillus naozhouensis]|uniref:Creatininase family protein n=1 Tax=Halobacillus naozhouensis TaxID=554880 RepID=A0ABY8IZC9_9BACI|nr:creatininase family protein [Halobacillus naozhouensis]WFT75598.1 creatininase family protein [Halobacillus naozhouensis]